MIRRNHIETITRIDRDVLRKPVAEQRYKRYPLIRQPDIVDQNFRASSNNKKYHQYKDWKESNRSKNIDDRKDLKEASRQKETLSEFASNEEKLINKYKKDQECELEQLFRKELINHNQKDRINTKEAIDKNPNSYKYLKQYPKERDQLNLHKRRDSIHSQKAAFESSFAFSPEKKRTSFQSTRKYSINLPSERPIRTNREYDYSSSSHNTAGVFEGEGKVDLKSEEFSSKYGKRLTTRGFDEFQTFAKQPKEVNNFHYENIDRELYRSKGNQIPLLSVAGGLRSLQVEEGRGMDEKVSDKLKMISNFNDQINERIKNIIVCFEELKNKI